MFQNLQLLKNAELCYYVVNKKNTLLVVFLVNVRGGGEFSLIRHVGNRSLITKYTPH